MVFTYNRKSLKNPTKRAYLRKGRYAPAFQHLVLSCWFGKFNSYSHKTVLLEFESKEICMFFSLKFFFKFLRRKHSQQDARKCADWRHLHPCRLGRYYSISFLLTNLMMYDVPGVGHLKRKMLLVQIPSLYIRRRRIQTPLSPLH